MAIFVKLYSVASVINTDTQDVYALYQDGRHDEDSKTKLSDMPEDWLNSLDKYDKELMKRYLNIEL